MTSFRETLPPSAQMSLFESANNHHGAATETTARVIDGHGSNRRDRCDVSNFRLLDGLTLVGPHDIPKIGPCRLVPSKMIVFSEAMRMRRADPDAWVHFYEDDYRFQRLWRAPETYFPRLRSFAGVVSPDFSLYRNMPAADRIHNTHRNQLLGARLQTDGANVIANVRLSGRASIPYALAGAPRNSTIALGLHGCTKNKSNRRHVVEEIALICHELAPANLVAYGSAAYGVLDYPLELGIPVHTFPSDTFKRAATRKAAA
jgi:hypothetical protein